MFICQACHEQSKPYEKQHKLVTEYRRWEYSPKLDGTPCTGQEIVKEISVCSNCNDSVG